MTKEKPAESREAAAGEKRLEKAAERAWNLFWHADTPTASKVARKLGQALMPTLLAGLAACAAYKPAWSSESDIEKLTRTIEAAVAEIARGELQGE